MIDQHAVHTAYVLQNAQRRPWPYPHMMPEGILAPDLFEQVRAMRLERAQLTTHAQGALQAEAHRRHLDFTWDDVEQNRMPAPALEAVYRVLNTAMVKRALIAMFAGDLARHYGTTQLPLNTSLTYVEDETGYELLPHTDAARKAVTLLIYLAQDDDNPDLGTEMYVPRDPNYPTAQGPQPARHRRENFLRVNRVPFRPNNGLVFAPAGDTFHGVGAVSQGAKTRRLLQFQLISNRPRAVQGS